MKSLSVCVGLVRMTVAGMLLAGLVAMTLAANQPPVVSAGADASYKTGNLYVYLEGDATDDSTSVDSLDILWRQISGPAQATILSSSTLTTRLTLTSAGVYVFELWVSDGTLSATDTTIVTITASLPFAVLAPQNLQQVQIGKPFTIRWQREPLTSCQVFYSIDAGLTWVEITVLGAALGPTITWDVDPDLVAGTQGLLKVMKYLSPDDMTLGSFTLVDHPPIAARSAIGGSAHGFGISIDNRGAVRIRGIGAEGVTRMDVFAANGARVHSLVVRHGSATLPTPNHSTPGVMHYRLVAAAGGTRTGSLVYGGD